MSMFPRPPRFAEALFARLLSPADREVILGDLQEEYERVFRTRSRAEARRVYWSLAFRSVVARWRRPPAAPAPSRKTRGAGPVDTFLQDLQIAWRGVTRRPGFAAAVVLTL